MRFGSVNVEHLGVSCRPLSLHRMHGCDYYETRRPKEQPQRLLVKLTCPRSINTARRSVTDRVGTFATLRHCSFIAVSN